LFTLAPVTMHDIQRVRRWKVNTNHLKLHWR